MTIMWENIRWYDYLIIGFLIWNAIYIGIPVLWGMSKVLAEELPKDIEKFRDYTKKFWEIIWK